MAINLQIDQALNPETDQPVKDGNGTETGMFVAPGRLKILSVAGDGQPHFQIGDPEPKVAQPAAKLSFAGFGIEHAGFVWIPDGQLSNGKLHLTFGGRSDPTPRGKQPARVTFQANGRVGIGTMAPDELLDVKGNIMVSGDVKLAGEDCAEDFDVRDPAALEAGMVMVIGAGERLERCCHPYDRRVAGVLSGAGDYRPGIVLGRQRPSAERLPLALTGKVYCMVDAAYSQVDVGDLLTTSPRPGHAMRAGDPAKAFGAVLGKALRPLRAGRELVPILVALQ
jgi:hypothetical protein